MIYRSSFLKEEDGTYRIWYSASSWGRHFGIGYVHGGLDALGEDTSCPLADIPAFPRRLLEDLRGYLGYQVSSRLPVPLVRALKSQGI